MDKSIYSTVHDISETSHHPPKRDVSFYLALVFAVLPIWSIVPLSWAFVVYNLHLGKIWTAQWSTSILFVVAFCEVFFSVHHYMLARSISKPSSMPYDRAELQITLQRITQAGLFLNPDGDFNEESLDTYRPATPENHVPKLESNDPRAMDFRHALRNWFGKIPWSSIRRKEVYAWIYWSVFNAHMPDEMSPARQAVLDDVLERIQRRSGSEIPEGSSGVPPLLLTVDPVNVHSRPLFWYLFVGTVNWILRHQLRILWNVRFGTYKGMEYLLRVPSEWDPRTGARPVVILHGLGLGLFQYQLFLSHLLHTLPGVPILIPLQPHISQDIFHARYLEPMDRQEKASCLAGLLQQLDWVDDESPADEKGPRGTPTAFRGVTVLSHSNGSFVHSWLLKNHPRMISRSCFVDPVAFCTWEGDVCYNFIYRPPTNAIELLMRYYVATELGVANVLQRRFDFTSNSLWCEEIPEVRDPSKNMFFLGGKDSILNAQRVRRYLRSHGVTDAGLWYDPAGRHGQALLAGGQGHREIIRWLQEGHI